MPSRKLNPKATRTTLKTEAATTTGTPANVKTPKAAEVYPTSKNETNPGPSPPTSQAFKDYVLSEPWMLPWAEAAVDIGSTTDACARVGISIADFAKARSRDSVFDSLCRIYEEVVDLKIRDTLCSGAIKGEARFLSLYFGRVRELLFESVNANKTSDTAIPAAVAEAMIRAGLAAEAQSTALKSAPPKRQSVRDPQEAPLDE